MVSVNSFTRWSLCKNYSGCTLLWRWKKFIHWLRNKI